MVQKRNHFLELKETELKQRNELITKLLIIIKSEENSSYIIFEAIDLLGQIRAIEASNTLLDMVDFTGLTPTSPPTPVKKMPAVKALIMIRPPYEDILKKLTTTEYNGVKTQCYITILIGIEGAELTQHIIEKAIEKETDENNLKKLNSALNILNKYYLVKEETNK